MNLRLTLAAVTIVCVALVPSYGAEPLDTYQALSKCADIPDSATRLACYDALMPRVRAALAQGPEQLSHSDQTSLFGLTLPDIFGSSEPSSPQQFGANDLPAPAPAPAAPGAPPVLQSIDSITATVTDYATTPLGKFVVFLDNGQVWRQQESDSGTAYLHKGDKITIERAMLGSYALSINGGNKTYRVNRIK